MSGAGSAYWEAVMDTKQSRAWPEWQQAERQEALIDIDRGVEQRVKGYKKSCCWLAVSFGMRP